jgi:hypothetical protein
MPLIWATGAMIHFNEREPNYPYWIYPDSWHWDRAKLRVPTSDYDLWQSGWPFPIP